METIITQQDLHEIMNYDKSTGHFSWKKKRRGVSTNKTLGTDNGFGYLRITVLGKSYYAHRLAWLYVHGCWPDQIGHINGVKSDNRIKNLRSVTVEQNNQNILKPRSESKSQILGVSWHKKSKKWQAHICIYKQKKYLGLFSSIEEAQKAYLSEKEKIDYEHTKTS